MKAPTHSPRVIVVGSSNTDLVLRCDRLPRPGETLHGGLFQRFAGGKGANQAVAAARAGVATAFVGAHGADDLGSAARAGLLSEGIDLSAFVEKPGLSSGVALILIGASDGQNLIGVARSANDALTAAEVIAAAKRLFTPGSVIVSNFEVPLAAVTAAAQEAHRRNLLFVLNPAPAQKVPAALLKHVSVLTPNETEAELLASLPGAGPEKAAARLLQKGCRAVVVTLGAEGVLLAEQGRDMQRIPARKVRARDTVGAGDCFTGWLAAGLAEGLSLHASAVRAVQAASLKVTRPGAQAGMPRREEVLPLAAKAPKKKATARK